MPRLFNIRNAYAQLVLLIFTPISILALISSLMVFNVTYDSALSTQRNDVAAIFSRYLPVTRPLLKVIEQPGGAVVSEQILRSILVEPDVKRAALIDQDKRVRIAVGLGSDLEWPKFSENRETFGSLEGIFGRVYGQRVGFVSDGPIWLLIEMDEKPIQVSTFQALLKLVVTVLVTLLLLLLCLNIFSRQWIVPINNIRLRLKDITKSTLVDPIQVRSSGELLVLQQDINVLLGRVHRYIEDVEEDAKQAEEDFQRNLDALELQNLSFRRSRDQAILENSAKSVFLANISHELRTPLNSIEGFISLLIKRSDNSREQRMYLNTIRKSAAHLLALINDVLDFSKIEAGKLEIEQAPFNILTAIYDVMDMLAPSAYDKKLNMAVYFYEDVPVTVVGDMLRFKQVLTNLVNNAIKFTPDGEIIVRVSIESETSGHQMIQFSVQDTGIGIGDAEPEKLFESFGQADISVTRQFGGTGLGLSIVKQLTKLMGGQIGAGNNQDLVSQTNQTVIKGSTFWFSIDFGRISAAEQHWQQIDGVYVIGYMEHTASMNVFRGYLNRMNVTLEEASSLPDLFNRLSKQHDMQRIHHKQRWVITDCTDDPDALISELRQRFDGNIALFGSQTVLDSISDGVARLYAPLNPLNLQRILQNQTEDAFMNKSFRQAQIHMLIVDDHQPNLMVLDALLQDLGVTVTTASSGLEAINIITLRLSQKLAPFSMILMDIQMPRMSGVDATIKIRQLESKYQINASTPIVALTAHALKDERQSLIKKGMSDYASKPISQEQLCYLIEKWTLSAPDAEILPSTIPSISSSSSKASRSPSKLPMVDWAICLQQSAKNEKIAFDLLSMLIKALPEDQAKIQKAFESGGFEVMYQEMHRLLGATRYTGVPKLAYYVSELHQILVDARTAEHLSELKQNKLFAREMAKLFEVMHALQSFDLSEIQAQLEKAFNA